MMNYSFLRFVVVVISLAVVATVSADDAFADKAKILQNENAAVDDEDHHQRKLDTAWTKKPTGVPTKAPTAKPTNVPTVDPTPMPSKSPTFKPTRAPVSSTNTESPTLSSEPTAYPTMAPTVCSESYLDSESLNIALVVDLSFSTYEKDFSSTVDIGDVNGDGKGNTILDAQIIAIQDLLTSIAESDTLNNNNCEIELISFETDAKSHGVWKPLNDAGARAEGDAFNAELMEYIKSELRAPTSNDDVFNTNNGFTNFDAALDRTVQYFETEATPSRLNLLVFLSDGEPNVRGDGDNEEYCADTTVFWNGDDSVLHCSDLGLAPGEKHEICRSDDPICVEYEPYQDCVRGPNECMNADAVTQYDSEISKLTEMKVERLAIGVGDESNIAIGSALWKIDNNPGKDVGVLPLQALNLEELSTALSHLCILNTDPPTASPSASPSSPPTKSPAPSSTPTDLPSATPSSLPSAVSTDKPTPEPTTSPSGGPTSSPTSPPTTAPSTAPTTAQPSSSPTASPTSSPSALPSYSPTASPSAPPSGGPSSGPTVVSTTSPSESPSGSYFPSSAPSDSPTKSPAPSKAPSGAPSASPTNAPSSSPSGGSTASPTTSPSGGPTSSPSASPSNGSSSSPTTSPTISTTISSAPTFLLPDCYDGPKLVKKDSSDIQMCYYNQDMVQINEMNNTDVTIAINNVWTQNALPEQLRVFVHTNGVDSIATGGEGFQCMDDDGDDIDIEGDNEFTVKCYQESEDAPFLAIIDVVITDGFISASNDVPHPCNPEDDPILGSCSWRIVIPCSSDEMCTDEPTTSPSANPTMNPTNGPTVSSSTNPSSGPTTSPSDSPTSGPTTSLSESPSGSLTDGPTASPTKNPTASPSASPITNSPITLLGADDDDDDIFFPPIGPEVCPDDILLIKHEGVTDYIGDTVRIISQDTTSVTVALTQTYTSPSSVIDTIYYQYQENIFNSKCYEEDNVPGGDSIEITIECTRSSQIALLEVWMADDVSKGVMTDGDTAIIPNCCYPTVPEGTPVTKYFIEIKCVTECPEVYE